MTSPLSRAQRFAHSPAVYYLFLAVSPAAIFFPFLFTPLACPADPFFGVTLFRSRQESGLGSSGCCGVGVRWTLLPGYVGVRRTQGHR